jgi:hypothetical protein
MEPYDEHFSMAPTRAGSLRDQVTSTDVDTLTLAPTSAQLSRQHPASIILHKQPLLWTAYLSAVALVHLGLSSTSVAPVTYNVQPYIDVKYYIPSCAPPFKADPPGYLDN